MPALTHLVSSNILALRATTTDAAASATTSTFVGYDSDDYGDDDGYFWYSEKARLIKWAVFLGILGAIALFLLGAYIHAQKRMKKGLPPLRYHRGLVPRAQRARWEPHLQPQYVNRNPAEYYGMYPYPPPPPAYNPDFVQPPQYDPTIKAGQQPQHYVGPVAGEGAAGQQPYPYEQQPDQNGVAPPATAHTEQPSESRRWRFGRRS